MERPTREVNKTQRFTVTTHAAVPLKIGDKVRAPWKGNGRKGTLFDADVVGINEHALTCSLVFTHWKCKARGDTDDACPLDKVVRINGAGKPAAPSHAGGKAASKPKLKRRGKSAKLYTPYYTDIKSATLQQGPGDFAKRLKFKIGNGLYYDEHDQYEKDDVDLSLEDMLTSAEFAPVQHDRNLFAAKISEFMVKLLDTPPSAEQKAALLSGL